ncbi:MupA/Atu3671 family FMN-dependent luciferase-like monooxygenase [Actinoplanes sp. NPDC049265]|uniref:MupA/Atu3671 family FMN-dependent luciferase-like monooxygenase n=1 Tax=Actinoplanes sp. NPDC049265 TaxID=3363902 RepID=UPI003714240D
MDFSLFFFADSRTSGDDRYRLLLDSARFADAHDFTAVWTPERHFHPFGGLYPNAAVTGAALAAITERLDIRAGSVVAPLHHPARIAEEWSVVDNLSQGRAGISFASGWHATDFVLRPQNYPDRRAVMMETVETVRRLWRGDDVAFPDGAGVQRPVRIHPAPVRPELPVWITSAGSLETFRAAGRARAGVLTHLLGQDLDDLAVKIAAYREESAANGTGGHVVLMLHTLIGADRDQVRELVREPMYAYLRGSIDLVVDTKGAGLPAGFDPRTLPERDKEFLIARSFDRYFSTSGLFGTVDDATEMVRGLARIGVDEVAGLVDFGVADDEVRRSLRLLNEVRRQSAGVAFA